MDGSGLLRLEEFSGVRSPITTLNRGVPRLANVVLAGGGAGGP